MKPTTLVLYVLSCVAAMALLVACASQAQRDAGHDLAAAVIAATDNASPGGASVTAEEESHIKSLVDAGGFSWAQLGAGVIASLLGVIPMLRYLIPNRMILGTEPDPEVRRAAGLRESADPH